MSQMSSGTGDPSVQPSDNQGVRRLQAHENESDDLRLIEFFLPVTELNDIAAAEKKHPKHPVALIHYWPARRPITACRAAIYAALVPAPKGKKAQTEAAAFVQKLADELKQQACSAVSELADVAGPTAGR